MDEASVALFEIFLWQGYTSGEDDTMNQLLNSSSKMLTITSTSTEISGKNTSIAGFDVQCSVQFAVGNATVDPAHRTYSGFRQGTVAVSTKGDADIYGVQICALQSLRSLGQDSYKLTPHNAEDSDSTWLAVH